MTLAQHKNCTEFGSGGAARASPSVGPTNTVYDTHTHTGIKVLAKYNDALAHCAIRHLAHKIRKVPRIRIGANFAVFKSAIPARTQVISLAESNNSLWRESESAETEKERERAMRALVG